METDDKILLQEMAYFLLGSSSLCGLNVIVFLSHCSTMLYQSLSRQEELGEIRDIVIVG
jgi:hypothetical protein